MARPLRIEIPGALYHDIADEPPSGIERPFRHASNPYGFSDRRSLDEDNVDFNRSFVVHAEPYPPNEAYEQLAVLVALISLSTRELLNAQWGVARYRVTICTKRFMRRSRELPAGQERGAHPPRLE